MTTRTPGKNDHTVTIANNTTQSSAAYLNDAVLSAVIVPAAFDGTTITFQGSLDGTTYYDLYTDAGAALSATVAAGKCCLLNIIDFVGFPYIKITSGTNQTPACDVILLSVDSLESR